MKVASAPAYALRCGWIRIVHDQQLDVNITRPTATLVRWHRPPPSWVKVNTDGSSFGSSSSCGGIFRDHGGKALGCFSLKLGEGTAFEAELAACINAVDIASDSGWKKLWLESDCTRVVELLYSRSTACLRSMRGRGCDCWIVCNAWSFALLTSIGKGIELPTRLQVRTSRPSSYQSYCIKTQLVV